MSAPETSALLEELGIAAIGIAIGGIGAACIGIAIGGEDGIGAAGANIGIGAAGANIGVAIGRAGAIDEGMANGIEAGSGSGDDEVRSVRGATDGGAGGAIEGARGAIGALLARGAIDAWLAVEAGASGAGGSVMRRVPGATLTGDGLSLTALIGAAAASRPFVSSASASAISGGRPWAVAASS